MNPNRKAFLTAAACFAVLVLITFGKSFDPDLVLSTTDDPLGQLQYWKTTLPSAWMSYWMPDNLVGLGGGLSWFTPTFVLLWLLPAHLLANWMYALDAFGAGIFFFLFLRKKECSSLASLLGAVIYAYGSVNFSLVHAGHLGKFGCYLWFAATLWALECSFREPKRWPWRIAAAAFLGLTVSEQPDVAILYVWLFVAWLAFRTLSEPEEKTEVKLRRFVGLLAFSGAVSGLVAANVVISQYHSQVQNVVQVSEENKQQSWDWATQWSYPPEETWELVAPGFFGWRLDEPKGVYWGRMGRSADYDPTKQGFPRFKLDTTFLGIVPMFLAISMAVFAFRKRFRDAFQPPLRRELIFWSIVAIVTLLLAFGRYFIAYYFFYAIPKMNILRNPNKFMHLFSIAVAVLSAYGFHHLIEQPKKSLDTRLFWKILAGIGAVAFMGALYVLASNESMVARFHEEFKDASAAIVSNMANALWRLAVSCGVFAVLWFWLNRLSPSAPRFVAAVPYLVVLLATVDLYLTNRHYVEYYEYKPLYAENDLIRFLKSDPEPQRCKILPRDPRHRLFGLYNNWLTFLFPYYRVQTLDTPQMPRMPMDYQQYLSTVEPSGLRFWELTSCKYLLAPLEYWQPLQSDPLLRSELSLAFAYNLAMSNNVIVTTPAAQGQFNPNTQIIIRVNRALPRVKFFDRWRVIESDNPCLRTLTSREFDPSTEVLVSDPITPQTNAPPAATEAKIEWLHHTDNAADLRVVADRPGVVLLNEKYDPSFAVTVDGKPSQLLRCNYLMKGALVEAGTHEVRFEYRPPRTGFYVSVAAWAGCLIAIPALRVHEKRSSKIENRRRKR